MENSDDCDSGVCCEESTTPASTGWSIWIWILIILIVLVILAIIFRNKLRPLWMRTKSVGGSGSNQNFSSRPRFPPTGPSSQIPMGSSPRRIYPPQMQQRQPMPLMRKPQNEMDNVLKKLKDMGN